MKSTIVFFLALLGGALAGRAAGLEDQLNARWRGGHVVARLDIASSCDGYYNDNDVIGGRVESTARRRFAAGEAARVERVGVRRGRIDVFLDLSEGVLEEIHDGPFTLYEKRACAAQLRVPMPERWTAEQAQARLAELLELYGSAREAEASPAWNKRRREPFPEDYEKTLAAYEVWKAAQRNAAIRARIDEAIEEVSRIGERVHSDPEYLQGFAEGVAVMRDPSMGECGNIAGSSFRPDSRGGKNAEWRRGYEDGQILGWNLALLRRLKECFVPAPAG
jgi:hypothetical protein